MNTEEVYNKIREWELDAGESFIDYFDGEIQVIPFMFWCYGKGYVTKEKMDKWIQAYHTNDIGVHLEATCANYFISGYDVPFAIFPQTKEMTSEECYEQEDKGLHVLAEFIASTQYYIDKLNAFIEDYYEDDE